MISLNNILRTAALCLTLSFSVNAQVGVNTITPNAILDVNGDVKIEGSMYLEDPGDNNSVRDAKLLIKSTDDAIKRYDISVSKYGPINYVQYVFNRLSKDGLQDYDTKISTQEYIVSIQGYYFLEANTTETDVMLHSLIDNYNIEGYQIYAYPNTTTGTWFIRAFVNNAEFVIPQGGSSVPSEVDFYMNVVIYRRGFIAKSQSSILVNMLNQETGTANLPSGF